MEVTRWWTGFGCRIIWLLRVVFCREIGDLLGSFHCTRVKERRQNAAIIEVLAYAGILVDRVSKRIEGLIGEEQEGLRAGRGCVDHIFTLKQIGEKAQEKKRSVCGFYESGKSLSYGQ